MQNANSALSEVTATQANPFHNDIDLSTEAGNKLYQQATKGLLDEENNGGNPKGVIKSIGRVASKA